MQLQEYHRDAKKHPISMYMKALFRGENSTNINEKKNMEYSEHRLTNRDLEPPVIETLADYMYNRRYQ